MSRIRIIKKNDEYTSEYDIGDIFEVEGTWYGGVHIMGKTGVPISLDREEYMELDTEPEPEPVPEEMKRDIRPGDIVRHFKREWVSPETSEYLYRPAPYSLLSSSAFGSTLCMLTDASSVPPYSVSDGQLPSVPLVSSAVRRSQSVTPPSCQFLKTRVLFIAFGSLIL